MKLRDLKKMIEAAEENAAGYEIADEIEVGIQINSPDGSIFSLDVECIYDRDNTASGFVIFGAKETVED